MTRLLWFAAGALVSHLLRRRDDFEDRLDELEAEADARREAVTSLDQGVTVPRAGVAGTPTRGNAGFS